LISIGRKAQALIRVRLAKMRLYEAKVGIAEAQKRWDKDGQGKFLFFTTAGSLRRS
jgi:hypothetical protein